MRVIASSTLREFWLEHGDAEQPLRAWYHEVKAAQWDDPSKLKNFYLTASILKAGRVVFNISGNKFRLVCQISYAHQIVFVKFVGTHEQYDQIDAQTVEMRGRS
jgi:mRNA interferase HigB